MTTWWEAGSLNYPDGYTFTGTVDGRTWTINGDDVRGSARDTVRVELANALADQVTEQWGVTVTPYPPTKPNLPAIWLRPDSPFFAWRANRLYVYAYEVVFAVRAKHSSAWDWFERIGPLLVAATRTVPGALFDELDGPEEADIEDGRYLVAVGHITITRQGSNL